MSANRLTKISAVAALVGFGWVGAAYFASLAGALMPESWLLGVGGPALFVAAIAYILRFYRANETAIFLKWWIPAL